MARPNVKLSLAAASVTAIVLTVGNTIAAQDKGRTFVTSAAACLVVLLLLALLARRLTRQH